MGEQQGSEDEWAEIERMLPSTGRDGDGLVLALKEGFGGIIPTDGMVQSERGTSAYTGPTFVEDWDASGISKIWTAVVVMANNAAQFFGCGDMVAFSPQPDSRDGHRSPRLIELDARGWTAVLDFYDALLPAIGAPAWHGKNINALVDSMTWGGINKVEPPYEIHVKGIQGLMDNVLCEIEQAKRAISEKHGHNVGVCFRISP